jgi:gliding motility-associated-like protein
MMIGKKRLFLLAFFFFFYSFCFAQTDTAFWFAAPKICQGHENTPEVFRLSSYGKAADITISEPANSAFTPYTIHLNAYTATTVDITSQLSVVENQPYDSALNLGIKITATADISAYYEVGHSNNPEIFSLKGNTGTGLNFLVPGQTTFSNASGGIYVPQPKNGFVIVATEDNTHIDITLSNDDIIHPANTLFTIVLNKGQTYAVVAKNITPGTHLGGSTVKADKPVCITIYDDSIGPSTADNRDLVGDQILPENNNGTEFIIVKGALAFPLYNNGNPVSQDYYYIWATTDGTIISVNGSSLATINSGQCYAGTLADPSAYIETSNPVYLYQVTGEGGEMASTNLPSIKCTGSQLVSFVRSTSENFQLNILCKATDVNNFSLNGKTGIITSNLFSPVPATNGVWMAARITNANLTNIDNLITAGTTTVVSNTSGLFHLGFLNGGTSTGTRLGYFSNYSIAVLSPTVTSASCLGDTIQLSATQVSGATYQWTGPASFSGTVSNPVIPDASFNNSGMYYVQAFIPGCLSSSDSILITINPLPTVSFVHTRDTLCYGSFKNIGYTLTGKAPWSLTYSDGVRDSTLTQVEQPASFLGISPLQNRIYSIKEVTDSNACKTDSATITSAVDNDTVTVNVLPTATILNSPFCAGPGKTLDISLTGKTPWTLIYSLGNEKDTVYPINTPVYSIPLSSSSTGTLTIVSVSDANGCTNDTLKQSATLYPWPHAAFGVTSEVCLRDTAVFSDNSNGQGNIIVKWQWDFGDGGIDSVQNPGHRYVLPGTDSVRLLVYTDKGCKSDTAVKAITVNPLPVAGFSFSSPLCETGQIIFTDTSVAAVGSITSRNWDMGNGDFKNQADNTPFPETYATAGNYSVRLAIQNSKGCRSDTTVTQLTIHSLPRVGFIMPEVCLNDAQAQFGDTSSIADGSEGQFTYQWNFNESGVPAAPSPLTSSQKNPVVHYSAYGDYQVSLKVTSQDGCTDSLIRTFTVNGAIPKADLTVLYPAALCSNDSVRLQDMSTVDFGSITRVEISWDTTSSQIDTDDYPTSGTVSGTGKTYSHRYADFQQPATQLFYIRLTAYSGISCVSAKLDSVLVHQSPSVEFSVLPVICNDTTAIQITQTRELTPGGITGGTFAYYGTGVAPDGLYTPQSVTPGTYPIQYVYTTPAGCKDSATQNITILASPKLILGPDLEVLQGGIITIRPQYYEGNDLQFLWTPSTYLNSDTARDPQATPFNSIRYKLTLTGTGNCTVSDSIYVTVLKSPLIPNAFSPNGDGINDTWSIKYLNSYPGCTVDVYNRYGQPVFHSVGYTSDWDGRYNGNPLPVGTYYYIINPKNGRQIMSGSVTIIR